MLKTTIQLTAFSALLALISFGLSRWGMGAYIYDYNLWVIVFFWVTHLLIQFGSNFLQKTLELDLSLVWLGGVSVRLITALFGFLVVASFEKENRMVFGGNFSAIYLSFLVFEISTALSNLRRNSRFDRSND